MYNCIKYRSWDISLVLKYRGWGTVKLQIIFNIMNVTFWMFLVVFMLYKHLLMTEPSIIINSFRFIYYMIVEKL